MSSDRALTPTHADAAADVQLRLAARPENVAVVRHVMGAFGDVLDLPPATLRDVRLAVTEAVTNVVRHAYDHEDGEVEVSVRPRPGRLEIDVADWGRGIAPSADRAGPGLGMPMMATLADELEVDRSAHGGSRIAMRFDRTGPAE